MNYDLGYLPHCEGAWNNNTAYDPMAIVTNYGVAYISKVAVSAGAYEPGEAAGWGNYWQILAEGGQGATGQRGVQGYTGAQGARGNIGDDGAQGSRGPQGAVGTQGAAGTAASLVSAFRIKKEVSVRDGQPTGYDAIIDKLEGGSYYDLGSAKSFKINKVVTGDDTTASGMGLVTEKIIPAYIEIAPTQDITLTPEMFGVAKDSQGHTYTPTRWATTDRLERCTGGQFYVLTILGNTITVHKYFHLVSAS